MVRLTSIGLALAAVSQAASAQYIGGHAPAPPLPPAAGTLESSEAALARNVRLLAINPMNYDALLGAGRAALRLGDPQAAVGFFGRAEEIHSSHWAPKAGQASALAQMGEAGAALGMFDQAQRLGATPGLLALDRGLALDLLGRQAEAQADYRMMLSGPDGAEARRRLALSLAISGRKPDALAQLDPLLARGDRGARRVRAFILALGGDLQGARQAIGALMPGSASGFDPFLRRLATLGPGQKAAAVHLGMMPAEGAALAAIEPVPQPRVRTVPAAPRSEPNAARLAEIESTLTRIPTTPSPVVVETPPAPRPITEPRLAERRVAPERSPANQPAIASPSPSRIEQAVARPARAVATRIFVQVAGGADADRMISDFDRIRDRKARLFRGRQPFVSEVRGWARLVVGPFADQGMAQAFVNDLQAADLEAFVWTAPPGTKLEKLASQ